MFLKILQNSQETPAPVSFFNKVAGLRSSLFFNKVDFIKKETPAQVFSCEVCEMCKNTFSTEHLRAAASGLNPLAKM